MNIKRTIKYRVEEHDSIGGHYYLLHGIYDNISSARNKIEKLRKENSNDIGELYIIEEVKLITRKVVQ